MNPLKAFANLFRSRAARMKEAMGEDALIAGLDAVALTKSRVQQSGLDSQEQQFSDYVPSYAKQRSEEGYQTSYKDYTKTGQMFGSVSPELLEVTQEYARVEIKARTQDNQDKINGAFRKDGNILLNTDEEIEFISRKFADLQTQRLNG